MKIGEIAFSAGVSRSNRYGKTTKKAIDVDLNIVFKKWVTDFNRTPSVREREWKQNERLIDVANES